MRELIAWLKNTHVGTRELLPIFLGGTVVVLALSLLLRAVLVVAFGWSE